MSEEPRGISGAFAAGSVVGGYRLEEQIGQGGMAVVFRAYDARLGRRVALKILAPALARDDAFRQRFIGEWRAAAALDDRHIIPVFDAGEASGVLFIAMRYVQGGDVRSLLNREGPLPPARAIEIISQAASALDSTHARGLVHRDVKPANMLLEESTHSDQPDHVYLSDFGLTKALSAAIGLTGSGQLVGTVDYLAPEQIEGRPIDGRTDQYALACTAFELLTGVPPFHRHERVAVMYAQVTEPPPALSSQRPGLPAAADSAMARALAKSPADRYRTCREFATALRRAIGAVSDSLAAMPGELLTSPAEPLPTLPCMTGHHAESSAPRPAAGGQPTEAAGYPAASARPESSAAEPATETADIPATLARATAAIPPGQASTTIGAARSGGQFGDQESRAARRMRPWWRSPLPISVICAVAVAVGGYFLFGRGGSTALTSPGCTTSLPGLAKSCQVPSRKYTIGGAPFGVLESTDRQYTFVTVGNGIAVLSNGSGTSLKLLHTIFVPGVNMGLVTSPTGSYIIAAQNSGAVVINRAEAEKGHTVVKGTLTSQHGGGAVGIQLSQDGKYLFVTDRKITHLNWACGSGPGLVRAPGLVRGGSVRRPG